MNLEKTRGSSKKQTPKLLTAKCRQAEAKRKQLEEQKEKFALMKKHKHKLIEFFRERRF